MVHTDAASARCIGTKALPTNTQANSTIFAQMIDVERLPFPSSTGDLSRSADGNEKVSIRYGTKMPIQMSLKEEESEALNVKGVAPVPARIRVLEDVTVPFAMKLP